MTSHRKQPRFGYPRLGIPTKQALPDTVSIAEQRPLPNLVEPEAVPMLGADATPLARVEGIHPKIQVVPHYRLGGWQNSIEECWLRPEVARRMTVAVDSLPDGFGFVVYDGWRPRALQDELYEHALADPSVPENFLAKPSVDRSLSAPHETGGAIDLSLTYDGTAIAPGTDFDDFTDRATATAIENEPGQDREARRLLFWAMKEVGFVAYNGEWWHFEYGTRRWSGVTGEEILYSAIKPAES